MLYANPMTPRSPAPSALNLPWLTIHGPPPDEGGRAIGLTDATSNSRGAGCCAVAPAIAIAASRSFLARFVGHCIRADILRGGCACLINSILTASTPLRTTMKTQLKTAPVDKHA